MFSHGDTASDPAEISTASSNTEFLAALPKHYLTCTFPRLGVGFVCLDKVSRTMFRQEKGLIFAILVFTIPFESSIDVSFFPKGGEGRDPPREGCREGEDDLSQGRSWPWCGHQYVSAAAPLPLEQPSSHVPNAGTGYGILNTLFLLLWPLHAAQGL